MPLGNAEMKNNNRREAGDSGGKRCWRSVELDGIVVEFLKK